MSTSLGTPQPQTDQSDEPLSDEASPGRVLPAYAQPAGFALWLLATAAVGAVASFLLLYERVKLWNNPDHVTSCDINPWVSCGEVMESWQATTFGFPNIFIGVVAFPMLMAVAASLLAVGGRMPTWYYHGLQAGAVFAFGFITWLWYSAVYDIGVLCPYCMIVWTAVIPLFVVTTARNILHGVIPASEGLKRMARDWWWVIVLVLYLVVFTTILFQFTDAFLYGF